jgi:hypothetical protein
MIRWYWPAAEVATVVRDIPPPDTKVSTDTLSNRFGAVLLA